MSILSIKHSKSLQVLFDQVKRCTRTMSTPIIDLYELHHRVKFRFQKKERLLARLGVDNARFFSILCICHYLIIREQLLPVLDKTKSLHVRGESSVGKTSLITKFSKVFGEDLFFRLEDNNLIDFASYDLSNKSIIVVDDFIVEDHPVNYLSTKEYAFLKKLFRCDPNHHVYVKHKQGIKLPALPALLLSNNRFIFAQDKYINTRLHLVYFDEAHKVVWSNISDRDFKLLVFYAMLELLCCYSQKPLKNRDKDLNPFVFNLHFGSFSKYLVRKDQFIPKYSKKLMKK